MTSWDITSVTSSSIQKTCCHCNKNIDVLITASVAGSSFRLRFNGANTYYLLHSITMAKETTAPSYDANTLVAVSVGGVGGTSQITISSNSQVWSDWITYNVQANTRYIVSFFHVCGPDYYSQWSTSSAYSWVDGSSKNYIYDIDRLEVQ